MYSWVAPINERPATRKVNIDAGRPDLKTRKDNEVITSLAAMNTRFHTENLQR